MLGVITADLVHSAKASPDRLTEAQRAIEKLIQQGTDALGAKGELYRGDSFQLAVPEVENVLTCMLKFGATLASMGWQLTLSAAIGTGTLASKAGASQGDVFVLSGRELEQCPRGHWRFNSSDAALTAALGISTELTGFIVNQWTPKQAQVMSYWLQHPASDQQQIGQALGMTRQNVSLHWRKAGGPHIERYLKHGETNILAWCRT